MNRVIIVLLSLGFLMEIFHVQAGVITVNPVTCTTPTPICGTPAPCGFPDLCGYIIPCGTVSSKLIDV